MKILIINSAETGDRSFVDPIKEALLTTKVDIHIKEYSEMLKDCCDIDAYDAVIISASPKGNNANFDTRLKSFNWLRTTSLPVLGICAGHQLIGKLFGGELISDQESEDGISTVRIQKKDPIFEGCMDEFTVEQHHNDSITLPKDFDLLATSLHCRVQAIRHKTKPLYGVQWHAERSNPDIIRNFIKYYALFKKFF